MSRAGAGPVRYISAGACGRGQNLGERTSKIYFCGSVRARDRILRERDQLRYILRERAGRRDRILRGAGTS